MRESLDRLADLCERSATRNSADAAKDAGNKLRSENAENAVAAWNFHSADRDGCLLDERPPRLTRLTRARTRIYAATNAREIRRYSSIRSDSKRNEPKTRRATTNPRFYQVPAEYFRNSDAVDIDLRFDKKLARG